MEMFKTRFINHKSVETNHLQEHINFVHTLSMQYVLCCWDGWWGKEADTEETLIRVKLPS